MSKTTETVVALLDQLGENKIDYVIARNWDEIPEINGDLDLFINFKSLNDVKKILSELKLIFKWDQLISDESWFFGDKSDSIFVSYFRQKDFSECFQIDLFFGYSIYGMPYYNSRYILSNKLKEKNYFIIKNNLYQEMRFLQLYGYLSFLNKKPNIKTKRYIQELFAAQNKFQNFSQKQIKIVILKKRLFFILKNIVCNPIKFIFGFIRRLNYYTRVVKKIRKSVFIVKKEGDLEIKKIGQMLIKNKYIRDSIIIEKYNLFNIIKLLRVIERNGFVVIYSKYGQEQSKLNFFKKKKYQIED
jgi:hypothetical protein